MALKHESQQAEQTKQVFLSIVMAEDGQYHVTCPEEETDDHRKRKVRRGIPSDHNNRNAAPFDE